MNISVLIKELEIMKEKYGDLKVMIHSTHGETDEIDDVIINADKMESVIEIWS